MFNLSFWQDGNLCHASRRGHDKPLRPMALQAISLKLVLAALLLLSGCVSHEYSDLEPIESSSNPYKFQVGDSVQIITADGESHEFTIKEIGDTSVMGNDVTIEYADMRVVRLKSVAIGKTAGDTGLLSVTIVALLLIVVLVGV